MGKSMRCTRFSGGNPAQSRILIIALEDMRSSGLPGKRFGFNTGE